MRNPTVRPSKVLQKIRAGQPASCTKTNLKDSRVTEIAGMAGFDCVWVCMEHTANDWSAVEHHILAAKAYDMDVMVRVPRGSYSDLIKPFELDAAGIMVPHIMSLADAMEVVSMTRFHPLGRRPIDSGNADGKYCNIPLKDYIVQSNREKFVFVQIEDPESIQDIGKITALEGIDGVMVGPSDLLHAMGIPGQFDSPRLTEVKERVREACLKYDKIAAAPANPGQAAKLMEQGYRFISIGADVLAVSKYFQDIAQEFEQSACKDYA